MKIRSILVPLLNVVIATVTIAVCAVGMECTLRSRTFNGYSVWPPKTKHAFAPRPGIMPGIYGESRFSTNKYGMRGRNPGWRDGYRVVAIGGSTTECLYLDDEETWPHLLEVGLNRRLKSKRVWVGNIGRSAMNTRHHIVETGVTVRQMPETDAVVMMVGINDMSFRLSRDAIWRYTELDPPRYAIYRNQAFLATPDSVQPLVQFVETRRRLCRLLGCIEQSDSTASPQLHQDPRGDSYNLWRNNRLTSTRWRDESPDLKDALREYKRNLNEIVDIAEENGVRVVFATQPSIWKAEMPAHEDSLLWMGGVGRFQKRPNQPYYTPGILEEIIGKYNRALVDVCADREVEYVDLAAVIPKDTTAFYDDCHFNEKGAQMVADILTDYFVSNPPLDKNRRD